MLRVGWGRVGKGRGYGVREGITGYKLANDHKGAEQRMHHGIARQQSSGENRLQVN